MKKSLKNKLITSLSFGLFQLLASLLFGSISFVSPNFNLITYLSLVFLVMSIVQFVVLFFSIRNNRSKGVNKILYVSSFLVSGIIGGTAVWLIVSDETSNYFIHVASFIIASFLPTILYLLYFIYKEAEERISKLSSVSVKSHNKSNESEEKVFHLENNNGKLLLEVPIKNIICFEANDNYVVTHYLNTSNEVKKSMERISLKKIEEMLTKEDIFFNRVHKSFLVNPDYLDQIIGKAQAYKVKLKHLENAVPVSRTYDINQLPKQF